MIDKIQVSTRQVVSVVIAACLLALFVSIQPTLALQQIPPPDPKPGSFGVQATKSQQPPTRAARITTPGNGSSFSQSPISVNGICPTGLLVQIYNNDVMVGAVMCEGGSFSLEVSLFAGTNDLSAIVYDDLYQAGPKSNIVSVTYNDTNFSSFGELITLTSSYGRRSAAAGTQLSWPLQLSGGTGPYAVSIDWGDGSPTDLKSQALSGVFNINHTYKNAGIYQVNIRVTDANGVSAFLQVIAVASGEVDASTANSDTDGETVEVVKVIWLPAVATLIMLLPAYWLGRQSQLVSLRNKMLKERDSYQEK